MFSGYVQGLNDAIGTLIEQGYLNHEQVGEEGDEGAFSVFYPTAKLVGKIAETKGKIRARQATR